MEVGIRHFAPKLLVAFACELCFAVSKPPVYSGTRSFPFLFRPILSCPLPVLSLRTRQIFRFINYSVKAISLTLTKVSLSVYRRLPFDRYVSPTNSAGHILLDCYSESSNTSCHYTRQPKQEQEGQEAWAKTD